LSDVFAPSNFLGTNPKVPETTMTEGGETNAQRVDEWIAVQALSDWQRIALRDGTQRRLGVEVVHRHVWLWDGKEKPARHWHARWKTPPQTPRGNRGQLPKTGATVTGNDRSG
jgi:hypothetical protein